MDSSTLIEGFEDSYKKEAEIEEKAEEFFEEEFDMTLIICGVVVLLILVAAIVMLVVRKKQASHVDQIASSTFESATKGKPVPLINDDDSEN